MSQKRILVAPLNWGLGHATRCIPVIKELQKLQFEPVIASDGAALDLLKKEFPQLEFYTLPSYSIKYSKSRHFFRIKLLLKTPYILKTISAEREITRKLVMEKNISGIISDNRWGVQSKQVPSVFITHQIKVLSGITTFITSKIQQFYIKKFDECWVPDVPNEPSLSGKMGHIFNASFPVKYMGITSRFKKQESPIVLDIAIILSGPEPQRGLLESLLFKQFFNYPAEILLVRGVVEEEQRFEKRGNISVFNFLTSPELEKYLNQSKLIIARSGYTSLIDFAALQKEVFLIPTPGQYEQEYLAKRLMQKKIAASCTQEEFSTEKLEAIKNYSGLGGFSTALSLKGIFTLFHSK